MDLLKEMHAQGPSFSPQHPPREETGLLDFARLESNKAKYSKSKHLGFVYQTHFCHGLCTLKLFSFRVESVTQLNTGVSPPEFSPYCQKKRRYVMFSFFISKTINQE